MSHQVQIMHSFFTTPDLHTNVCFWLDSIRLLLYKVDIL